MLPCLPETEDIRIRGGAMRDAMLHAIQDAMPGLVGGLLFSAVMALLGGCGHPFEPGSDLPAEAPPAVLSDRAPEAFETPEPPPAAEGAPMGPIEGLYVIDARVQSPLGDVIEARFDGHFTQLGEPGAARLTFELRDPIDPETPGPALPAPVPLSADGAFVGTVPGMVVSPRFSDLLRAPAAAEITLDGRPIAPDCLAGRVDLSLIDAEVTVVDGPISLSMEGRFTAERAPGACGTGP